MQRAGDRCEKCGIKNYAVGYRNEDGQFIPTEGNTMHDAAGNGELSYKQARELVMHCNDYCEDNLIVVVITIAHLNHDVTDNRPENLAALCQKCHNVHDITFRKRNRKLNQGQLFLFQ